MDRTFFLTSSEQRSAEIVWNASDLCPWLASDHSIVTWHGWALNDSTANPVICQSVSPVEIAPEDEDMLVSYGVGQGPREMTPEEHVRRLAENTTTLSIAPAPRTGNGACPFITADGAMRPSLHNILLRSTLKFCYELADVRAYLSIVETSYRGTMLERLLGEAGLDAQKILGSTAETLAQTAKGLSLKGLCLPCEIQAEKSLSRGIVQIKSVSPAGHHAKLWLANDIPLTENMLITRTVNFTLDRTEMAMHHTIGTTIMID